MNTFDQLVNYGKPVSGDGSILLGYHDAGSYPGPGRSCFRASVRFGHLATDEVQVTLDWRNGIGGEPCCLGVPEPTWTGGQVVEMTGKSLAHACDLARLYITSIGIITDTRYMMDRALVVATAESQTLMRALERSNRDLGNAIAQNLPTT